MLRLLLTPNALPLPMSAFHQMAVSDSPGEVSIEMTADEEKRAAAASPATTPTAQQEEEVARRRPGQSVSARDVDIHTFADPRTRSHNGSGLSRDGNKVLMTPYLRRIMKHTSHSARNLHDEHDASATLRCCSSQFKDPKLERMFFITRARVTASARSLPFFVVVILFFLVYYLIKGVYAINAALASGHAHVYDYERVYYITRIVVFAICVAVLTAVLCTIRYLSARNRPFVRFVERHFSTFFAVAIGAMVSMMMITTGFKVYWERRFIADDVDSALGQAFRGYTGEAWDFSLTFWKNTTNTTAVMLMQREMDQFLFKVRVRGGVGGDWRWVWMQVCLGVEMTSG